MTNNHTDREFTLEVWADQACFTRPELKVERVSYDVITPSAARAVFEAIFWKPAIRWQVTKIEVLNPIRWMSVRRNEVGATASPKTKIYIEDKRQQRNSLMLRDVRYRITAKLVFIPLRDRPSMAQKREAGAGENPMKYYEMFERRASKGQCFNQPYLGTRECSCGFRLVAPVESDAVSPIAEDRELGIMLYDIDFANGKQAMFFRAKMEQGVISVPDKDSEEVLR